MKRRLGRLSMVGFLVSLFSCQESSSLESVGLAQQALQAELTSSSDTYVSKERKNKNFGSKAQLVVNSRSQALVQFEQADVLSAIGEGTLIKATLELTRRDSSALPSQQLAQEDDEDDEDDDEECLTHGPTQAPLKTAQLGLHRMTQSWTESGATFHCDNDSQPQNNKKNCTPGWTFAHAFNPTASATVSVSNQSSAIVSFDVTEDVADFVSGSATNFGWTLLKADNKKRKVRFYSRESAFAPRLVLEVQQVTSTTGAGAGGNGTSGSGASDGDGSSENMVCSRGSPLCGVLPGGHGHVHWQLALGARR